MGIIQHNQVPASALSIVDLSESGFSAICKLFMSEIDTNPSVYSYYISPWRLNFCIITDFLGYMKTRLHILPQQLL